MTRRETTQPQPRGGLVGALVGGGVLVSIAAGPLLGFRATGVLLTVLLTACALARLLLPVRVVGGLAVRSRPVDVVVLAVLAGAVGVLALTAPTT